MIEITMEQIDSVRNRANVGYKEAKAVLEKFDGDIIEAILYLEEEQKVKPDLKRTSSTLFGKMKDIFNKLNNIDIEIYKNEKTILNMPSTVLIVACIIALPFVIAGGVIAVFTGYKIKIHNNNKDENFTDVKDVIEIVKK
ncbi:DUF4342 domain-containing protein [Terrisporobacter vanillatitrophus]|uniref:DUF4342 domain-containing protein n=1 Tax=Terrisporobacter vanillatitrophus TaxID=3058402 RepID=UPI0033669A37